jgi:hypothetical protein
MTAPMVKVYPGVVDFLRGRGGRLFVWVSDAGLEHETTRPKAGVDFVELQGDGFSLYVDPAIETPASWSLVYHRFPRPHVRALWNGGAWSPTIPRLSPWEGNDPKGSPWRDVGRES